MMRFCVVFAAATLGFTPRGSAADLAALFPSQTLVYAEVRTPAAVVPMLAGLFAGTPWADPLRALHDRLDQLPPAGVEGYRRELGWVALAAHPDLSGESVKLGGAAAGLTGFTEAGEPLGAAVVDFGTSPLARFAVQAALLSTPELRRIATEDGVAIYQQREDGIPAPDGDAAEKIADPPRNDPGLTFAVTNSLAIVGTDRDTVTAMLKQVAKPEGKSLARLPAFQELAAQRDRPGLFLFATPAGLLTALDTLRQPTLNPELNRVAAYARFVANAEQAPGLAFTLERTAAGLELIGEIRQSAGPLLALLAGPAAATTLPDRLPTGAWWGVQLALPEGEAGYRAVVDLVAAVTTANGAVGPPPAAQDWAWTANLTGLILGGTLDPVLVGVPNGDGRIAEAWTKQSLAWAGGAVVGTEQIQGQRVQNVRGGQAISIATGQFAATGTDPASTAAAAGAAPAGPVWLAAPLPRAALRVQVQWPAIPAGGEYAAVLAIPARLPPLVAAVERTPTGLRVAIRQPLAPESAANLLDAVLKYLAPAPPKDPNAAGN